MKTMTCQAAQALLLDYAEGELDNALRAALREHITACPHCSRDLQEIERLRSALRHDRVPDPGVVFWEKFPNGVWQAYRAEHSTPSSPGTGTRAAERVGMNHVAQWWATMGLRLKFNLVLLVVSAVGLGATGYVSYDLLHKNAREEIVRNAGVILEAALSTRGYMINQISPLLPRLGDIPPAEHPRVCGLRDRESAAEEILELFLQGRCAQSDESAQPSGRLGDGNHRPLPRRSWPERDQRGAQHRERALFLCRTPVPGRKQGLPGMPYEPGGGAARRGAGLRH